MKTKYIFLSLLFVLLWAPVVLSVTLEWENPTTNCDDTTTDDLKEVWIYKQGLPDDPVEVIDAVGKEGQVQSADVVLPDGSWTLCIAAVDHAGNRSNTCGADGEKCVSFTSNQVPPRGCTKFEVKP